MLKLDGFDDCIIGICQLPNGEELLAYCSEKILERLQLDMEYDEAIEYYSYNILGAYVGPDTPLIIDPVPEDFDV